MLEFYPGNKILITGIRGFIGSALSKSLETAGCEIFGTSRGRATERIFHTSFQQPQDWQELLEGIEVVFHLAAQTSATWANQNPEADYEANVRPVLNLIECLKVKRRATPLTVIFAGTATQCGIPETLPVNETHPDRPVTVYDQHKLLAETMLLQGSQENLLKTCSLRLSNVYGPGPASFQKDRGVIHQMISHALSGKRLTLYGSGDFLRDYLFVSDAVAAFLAAAAAIESLKDYYYVLGSGTGHTLRQAFQIIAEEVTKRLSKPVPIVNILDGLTPIDQRNFVADSSRFERKTGWKPQISLHQGIQDMIEEQACVS